MNEKMARLRSSPSFHEIWEIVILASSLLIVIGIGTLGYSTIEGWRLFDSFYMTMITLATIGFQEVHPLSDLGRAFTIFLIIIGLGLVTVFFTTITQRIVHRQLAWAIRGKRMLETIAKLKGHSIFCGFGRLTRIAVQQLKESDVKLVIIERDPARAAQAREAGYLVVEGDASAEETLILAGIERATRLVSMLPKDADNLYVILTSREMNPSLFIMSRSDDEAGDKRLARAGANRIISPYRVGGQKVAEGLLRPYVTDFLDLAISSSGDALQIEEIRIPEESPVAGQTLREVNFRQKTNVIVAAIVSSNGQMVFNPAGETRIEGGTTFIALGLKPELVKLENLLMGGSA